MMMEPFGRIDFLVRMFAEVFAVVVWVVVERVDFLQLVMDFLRVD
jgi:hypothetical protein